MPRETYEGKSRILMLVKNSRELRKKYMNDPYRPGYHFITPEGLCSPFDPNGAIYWNGKYHLFYIFQDKGKHLWGHASSKDMLHWTYHPAALKLTANDPENGVYSGGAFINKNGVPTIIYHGRGVGNCIATSEDKDLIKWDKLPDNPIVPIPKEGDPDYGKYSSWDPDGWTEGEYHYGLFGGDKPVLFRSRGLSEWEYLHDFINSDKQWIDDDEDCSCPDFFSLGDKHMLLCISHKRGCRYYLGEYKNEKFYPQTHARMNWPGGSMFAPDSLIDNRGRRIFWSWVIDERPMEERQAAGWSGIMSLPRKLSLNEDGGLKIEPVKELKQLRLNHRKIEDVELPDGEEINVNSIKGKSLEIKLEIDLQESEKVGIKVMTSPGNEEKTAVLYNTEEEKIIIDFSDSTLNKDIKYHTYCIHVGNSELVECQKAPFKLKDGEKLKLHLYLNPLMILLRDS